MKRENEQRRSLFLFSNHWKIFQSLETFRHRFFQPLEDLPTIGKTGIQHLSWSFIFLAIIATTALANEPSPDIPPAENKARQLYREKIDEAIEELVFGSFLEAKNAVTWLTSCGDRCIPQIRKAVEESEDDIATAKLLEIPALIHSDNANRLLAETAILSGSPSIRLQALEGLYRIKTHSALIANWINGSCTNTLIAGQAKRNLHLVPSYRAQLFIELLKQPERNLIDSTRSVLMNMNSVPLSELFALLSDTNSTEATKEAVVDILMAKNVVPTDMDQYVHFLIAKQDWYLLSMAGPVALPIMLNELSSKNPKKRAGLAVALGNTQQRNVIKPLASLLNDESPEVRLAAKRALISMDRKSHPYLRYLLKSQPASAAVLVEILEATGYRPRNMTDIVFYESASGQSSNLYERREQISAYLNGLFSTGTVDQLLPFTNVFQTLREAGITNLPALPEQPSPPLSETKQPSPTPNHPKRSTNILLSYLQTDDIKLARDAAVQLIANGYNPKTIRERWMLQAALGNYDGLNQLKHQIVPYLLEQADARSRRYAAHAARLLFHLGLNRLQTRPQYWTFAEKQEILEHLAGNNAYLRIQAARGAAKLAADNDIINALIALLGDDEVFPRSSEEGTSPGRAAAKALSLVGTNHLDTLALLTASNNRTEQYNAALALSMISSAANASNLVFLLFSKEEELVQNAIASLNQSPSDDMYIPLIYIAASKSFPLRILAKNTLLNHLNEALPVIAGLVAGKLPDSHTTLCIRLIEELNTVESIKVLLTLLNHPSTKIRIQSINALRQPTHEWVVFRLLTLLKDPSEKIRIAALSALQTTVPSATYPIIKALGFPDKKIKDRALRLLVHLSGEDFGYDQRAWNDWRLEQIRRIIVIQPVKNDES